MTTQVHSGCGLPRDTTKTHPEASNAGPNGPERAIWRPRLYRLLTWWLPVSSIPFLTGSTCPFCGRAGCPTGIAGAGIVAVLFSLFLRDQRAASEKR